MATNEVGCLQWYDINSNASLQHLATIYRKWNQALCECLAIEVTLNYDKIRAKNVWQKLPNTVYEYCYIFENLILFIHRKKIELFLYAS